jgi:predicted porin
MKMKSLVMGSAMAAVAASAWAQSTVTTFGVIDVGMSRYSVSGGQNKIGMSVDNHTSSRFGVRGSEDLGGGLSAMFWLESVVNAKTPNALAFERRSVLGLTSRQWGTLLLGRDYTPGFNITGAFGNPWNTNGAGKSLLWDARASSYSGAGQSTSVRSSNAINYFLPRGLGGVYGQFMYAPSEANQGKPGRYIGARLGYAKGPWDVSAAYNTVAGGVGRPVTAPRDLRNLGLGVGYKFDFGRLSFLHINDEIELATGDQKIRGYSLGMTIPVGTGELRGAYDLVKYDHPLSKAEAQKLSLGYVHHLSKRTSLYTTAAIVENKNGATFASGGVSGRANATARGFDLGIKHSF